MSLISLTFHDAFSIGHLSGPRYSVEIYKIPNISTFERINMERLEETKTS